MSATRWLSQAQRVLYVLANANLHVYVIASKRNKISSTFIGYHQVTSSCLRPSISVRVSVCHVVVDIAQLLENVPIGDIKLKNLGALLTIKCFGLRRKLCKNCVVSPGEIWALVQEVT